MSRRWGDDGQRKTVIVFCLVLFLQFYQVFFYEAAKNYQHMEPIRGLKLAKPASRSILVDYISTDMVTTIVHALGNKHFRVAWFTLLALLTQLTPIVVGRILRQMPRKSADEGLKFMVDPVYFYLDFSMVCIYCVSLPFTRPPPALCAPHYLTTALDLYPYIYHSHLAQSPEFVTRHPLDEEEHLKAQVLLARRRYHFGLYRCEGDRRHIGISPSECNSRAPGLHRPVDKVVLKWGWLHFNYRLWFRPTIKPITDDRGRPYGDSEDAQSEPTSIMGGLPTHGYSPECSGDSYTSADAVQLVEQYTSNVHETSADRPRKPYSHDPINTQDDTSTSVVEVRQQPEDDLDTVTQRRSWIDHRDLDEDSALLMGEPPLRLSQHSTWPQSHHKHSDA